jgi:hypothetical protein
LLHPGPLVADGALEIAVEPGAAPSLDLAAAADTRLHAFLRAAWFGAAAGAAPVVTLTGRRAISGEPIIALPLVERRFGWMTLREVPGSYWPYRSFPVASDASETELSSFLASAEARAELGRIWRVGPVYADDATAQRTMKAARRAGWTVLSRQLGTCYTVDLNGLLATGSWPSSKTLRKNRWLERWSSAPFQAPHGRPRRSTGSPRSRPRAGSDAAPARGTPSSWTRTTAAAGNGPSAIRSSPVN